MAKLVNKLAETFSMTDAQKRDFALGVDETVRVRDFVTSMPYAILGDLGIYDTAMTLQNFRAFAKNRSPIGFSPFRDFVPGEYRFRRAVIDYVFSPLDTGDAVITLTEAKVYADIPDLIESGTATITVAASGITVVFARAFKFAPRVTITPIGAAMATVVLSAAPTLIDFNAKMYNQAGVAIAGSFIWTAMGY